MMQGKLVRAVKKQELKKQIAALKQEMRKHGIRKISHFNGGLTPDEHSYNSRLFQLTVELERPAKQVECPTCHGKLFQPHTIEPDSVDWCSTCAGEGTVDQPE